MNKRGSCAVKISRDQKPQGIYFRAAYHLGGKRHLVVVRMRQPLMSKMGQRAIVVVTR